jgi:hypothetical protein
MSLAARGLSPNRKEKDYKKEKESSKKEKNPEFRPLAAFLHSFVAQVAVLTQESSAYAVSEELVICCDAPLVAFFLHAFVAQMAVVTQESPQKTKYRPQAPLAAFLHSFVVTQQESPQEEKNPVLSCLLAYDVSEELVICCDALAAA